MQTPSLGRQIGWARVSHSSKNFRFFCAALFSVYTESPRQIAAGLPNENSVFYCLSEGNFVKFMRV